MLPEPEKVARVIKSIFKTAKERRQEAEMEREVQVRMSKARLQRHIQKQKKMAVRLRSFAKRALAINDNARFRQVGRQLLWTQKDILQWEKYLLSLEILQARRDQANASVELIDAIKTMSESMTEMAGPQDMAELQRELETGLARASTLNERMKVMMEVMDATVSADTLVEEDQLADLEADLTGDIAQEEASEFDREIEDGLRQIRKELENEK